jgi:hypothetical protein
MSAILSLPARRGFLAGTGTVGTVGAPPANLRGITRSARDPPDPPRTGTDDD